MNNVFRILDFDFAIILHKALIIDFWLTVILH